MKTTTSVLKDNRRLLSSFLSNSDSPTASWSDMAQSLLTTEASISSETGRLAVPLLCLDSQIPAQKLGQLYEAVFQPATRLVSDEIMSVEGFNELIERWRYKGLQRAPKLCKGVSYPSQLRTTPKKVMVSDNIWMLDLFTRGVAYTRQMGDKDAYVVADTTIYEGWNQLSEEDYGQLMADLSSLNAGPDLISRYLDLLTKSEYRHIRQNIAIRGGYIRAICEVLGLPAPIQIEKLMKTEAYGRYLSMLLDKESGEALFSKNENPASYLVRDFSPFVFAEELTLRKLAGVDGSIGPLREELSIGVNVSRWHTLVGTKPTPIIWYTRPNKLPDLNFNDSRDRIAVTLSDPKNDVLLNFVVENLARINALESKAYTNNDLPQIVDRLFDVMNKIENVSHDARVSNSFEGY